MFFKKFFVDDTFVNPDTKRCVGIADLSAVILKGVPFLFLPDDTEFSDLWHGPQRFLPFCFHLFVRQINRSRISLENDYLITSFFHTPRLLFPDVCFSDVFSASCLLCSCFRRSHGRFVFPFMAKIPDNVESCADHPVECLCNPDTEKSDLKMNADEVSQCNSYEPHRKDADVHREFCIACGTPIEKIFFSIAPSHPTRNHFVQ